MSRHNLASWRENSSIVVKMTVSQVLLVFIPILCCLILFFNQLRNDEINANSNKCYSYCRYTLSSMETGINQIEVACDTMAKSKDVQDFLAVYNRSKSINKYYEDVVAPYVSNIHMIQGVVITTKLYATDNSSLFAYKYLSKWPKDAALEMNLDPDLKRGVWINQRSQQGVTLIYYQGIYDSRKIVGVLEVRLDSSMLMTTMRDMSNMINGKAFVVSNSNGLLYSDNYVSDSDILNIINNATTLSEGVHRISDSTVYYIMYSKNLPLKFVALQYVSWNLRMSRYNLLILVITLAIAVCSIIISVTMLYKSITRRLILLAAHMKSIDSMDLQPIEDVAGNDEIGKLASVYNAMLNRISHLARTAQQAELLSQQAAYRSLQAQIQPHFLYNTLETIRMMAEGNDDESVADMLYSFGQLLRHSIASDKQTTVLEDELSNLRNYLKLQQLRMIEWLTYSIDVETESVQTFVCPRFLLQPLVENSIQHGAQKGHGRDNRHSHINVTVLEEENGIRIKIEDNGLGMSQEKLAEVQLALRTGASIRQTNSGIGISNVQSRIKMFFGDSSTLTIDSMEGKGTICTLFLTKVHNLLQE